ncbi:ABC transporter permease subunit [Microbacterium sp. CFH 31415]|uniref:ABC transporter permease subunit n=1 Tax=Microbacterium sp. CFH 31415 TaxID=2921732 RepID=UPI001F134C84|nr:ABC transporter permease subunit [Microbacterium sp. CFH 31415]MCH6231683.1 ABC transporter permease subunit [Microbacterium sp. CFH 31415]
MSLAAATRSETTKQFSTAMWWVLAIVLAGYVGFTAAALGFVFAAAATGSLPGDAPPLPEDGLAGLLYSTATAVGYVFPLLIGTLMVTAEFRHKTLTPTFLATPRRGRVLWAKLFAGVVLGVLYGVIGIAAAVGPSVGFLAGYGIDTMLASIDTWAQFGRMLLAYVLWVLIGIGVGALVRNQVGAIVGVLVFTQFIEPIARLAATFIEQIGDYTQYLPGAASDALVGSSIFAMSMQGGSVDQLEWWVGGLVLAGYAVVFLVLGYLTSWRRDVS